MNTLIKSGLVLCCVVALHGCFNSDDNKTKNNSDGASSSVQMDQGKSDKK